MQSITPLQLKRNLEDGAAPELVDVREPWEFATCHIEGSINLPMSVIVSQYQRLNPRTEKVFICHHGVRSGQVARFLHSIGFESVINLEGGIDLWAATVAPEMPRY